MNANRAFKVRLLNIAKLGDEAAARVRCGLSLSDAIESVRTGVVVASDDVERFWTSVERRAEHVLEGKVTDA